MVAKSEKSINKRKNNKIGAPIIKQTKNITDARVKNKTKVKYYITRQINEVEPVAGDSAEIKVAKEVVKAQSSKKKKFMSFLFFLINIAIIATILLVQMKDGMVEDPGELEINWWYLAATCGMVGLFVLCDTLRFNLLIRRATGKNRFGLAYKIGALGKYYDVITPFSSGGQPFQIFYTNKYGIKGGESFSIVMSKYIFQQISYVIIIIAVLIGVYVKHGGISGAILESADIPVVQANLVATMSMIGFVVVTALMLAIAIVVMNKKVGTAIVVFFVRLFCKIFRRNYDKLFRKTMRTVTTWQATMRQYKKSPWVWIANILLSVTFYFALYSIPYFIYCAFMGWNASVWIEIIVLTIIIDMTASFMPLPGGTGVSDLSFLAVFASLFTLKMTFWALLLWRVFTYYIFILQGLTIIGYDAFIGNRRLAKNKEKWSQLRYDKIKIKNSLY